MALMSVHNRAIQPLIAMEGQSQGIEPELRIGQPWMAVCTLLCHGPAWRVVKLTGEGPTRKYTDNRAAVPEGGVGVVGRDRREDLENNLKYTRSATKYESLPR